MAQSTVTELHKTIRVSRPSILECPSHFDGTLEDFHAQYVVPNLLEPALVEYYHELLRDYCNSKSPPLVVRQVPRVGRWRISDPGRQIYVTRFGDQLKFADNSPAWWIYQVVASGLRIPRGCFADVLGEMPMHFHDIGKRISPSININARNWHVAHLFDAKDGDTNYAGWDRPTLIRRFIRTCHPCNLFFMPKLKPQVYGDGPHEKAFYYEYFSKRYQSIWREFECLAEAGPPPRAFGTTSRITFDRGAGGSVYVLPEGCSVESRDLASRALAYQAQMCVQIMVLAGKTRFTSSELTDELRKHKVLLKTVQDPWRIFLHYKRRLIAEGLLREERG